MKAGSRSSASGLRCPWTAWPCDCRETLTAWASADGKMPKRCQEMVDAKVVDRNKTAPHKKDPPARKDEPSLRIKHMGKACPYCGRLMGGKRHTATGLFPTIDHIVPMSRGGKNLEANKVFVCSKCNNDKDNTLIDIWLWNLEDAGDPRAEFVGKFMDERGMARLRPRPEKKMRWA
jgi:5-methylcytosine-specific restriction endonuclease McrA